MKKIIVLIFAVFLFAQNFESIGKSKKFQNYIDRNVEKAKSEFIKRKLDLVLKQQELTDKLIKNMDKLSDEELAENFAKINSILTKIWLDKMIYANAVYKEGKNIVFEFLVKDDEKMRKKFEDKKYKKEFYNVMQYTQNRRLCHHDRIMERLLEHGYSLVYRYKFYSNKKKIFDVFINKKTCKDF